MSSQNNSTLSPRETKAKQIDQNASIRSTYYSNDQLRDCAEAFARDGRVDLPEFQPFDFFARHRENEKEILRVYRSAAADVEAGETITPAAEWLLDNHYIVEEAIQEVRRDFPMKFYRQLETMTVDGMVMPRTLALAWLYVAHTHSTVTYKGLMALVDGFQSSGTLKIGELWALPSLVRYVLVENLRRISSRVEKSRQTRRKANQAADELIRLNDDAKAAEYLKTLEPLTVGQYLLDAVPLSPARRVSDLGHGDLLARAAARGGWDRR